MYHTDCGTGVSQSAVLTNLAPVRLREGARWLPLGASNDQQSCILRPSHFHAGSPHFALSGLGGRTAGTAPRAAALDQLFFSYTAQVSCRPSTQFWLRVWRVVVSSRTPQIILLTR